MILPGHMMMGFKKDPLKNYTQALDAITNKTLLLRADKITGVSDGATITAWNNEGTLGGNFAAANNYTFRQNAQNGFSYLQKTGGAALTTTLPMASIKGADISHTVFFAGKMATTAPSFWTMLGEVNGTYSFRFLGAGNVIIVCGDASPSWNTGLRPADGVDFVAAVKVNSTTSQRANVNGTVSSGSATLANPSVFGGVNISINDTTNTARIYEVIVSSDAVSDAAMDAMVVGLMGKWGIA